MADNHRFREIPYNYTSFSDREIILKYFSEETFDRINRLRAQRVTGRSARLIAETLGDMFIIDRNPYVREDFIEQPKRVRQLMRLHEQRLATVDRAASGNEEAFILLEQLRAANRSFFERLQGERRVRQRIMFRMLGVTSRKNISFQPFDRVSHSTDATDWRVEQPLAVLYPDAIEEIPKMVTAVQELGCSIVPRGGGTGLTGGAIPVDRRSLVLNMEKLNRIDGIAEEVANGTSVPVVSVEAGAVTEDVIQYCDERGLIFATDPTSAWASTIGGNIAENAGGKKCVQWGTAIDNLLSWRVVNAKGEVIEVRRRNHPYRKILPDDRVEFDVVRISPAPTQQLQTITLLGTEIRKRGLGKDITNKALGGLPALQKEGGDGVIISARFVLYRPFAHSRTLCLEFFGKNMLNASRAIRDIRLAFDGTGPAVLTALEHFDERYIRAINYRNRSPRTEIPKAVLLVDVEGNALPAVDAAIERICSLVAPYETEAIPARSEHERRQFWKDRKNLGAIARHTNAFKLNEDVVIPLEALPSFSDLIERVNLEKELSNSSAIIQSLRQILLAPTTEDDAQLSSRVTQSQRLCDEWKERVDRWMVALEEKAHPVEHAVASPDDQRTLFQCFQDGALSFSLESRVLEPIRALLHGYDELLAQLDSAVSRELKRRVIVATHMHAGDGNIHVNIPVHSSDYLMMQEADATASMIMREAVRMGGVVSGEHGIGLTKLKLLDPALLDAFQDYKRSVDPDQVFNPAKLQHGFPFHQIYTPSFSLLELEAFILEATDLEQLSMQIASCVRCGKCKPVCCTQIPQSGMMYNPRNKILAVGQITEAVLYHAQTSGMRSFRAFEKLKDISDHCTACHKCKTPCPVKIDFGNTTLTMRRLQARRLKSRGALPTRLALYYLWKGGYAVNKLLRLAVLKPGYNLQRLAHRLYRRLVEPVMWDETRIGGLLEGKLTTTGPPTLRERLNLKGQRRFFAFTNPDIPVRSTVIYFPGCGSERLYPEISMAAIALLYRAGIRTIIPPTYMCCGYPFQANGKEEQASLRSFENRVVFHRIADSIGASGIDAVLVSCGTCSDMLEQYELSDVFPNAPLLDVNEYLVQNGLYLRPKTEASTVLYHEPCHTPLKSLGYGKTISALLGADATVVPECCGDAGTLTLSRPDISCKLRARKRETIGRHAGSKSVEILTTCPSCVSGLSKQVNGHRVEGKSLVVHVADQELGKTWAKDFIRTVRKHAVEEVLF